MSEIVTPATEKTAPVKATATTKSATGGRGGASQAVAAKTPSKAGGKPRSARKPASVKTSPLSPVQPNTQAPGKSKVSPNRF